MYSYNVNKSLYIAFIDLKKALKTPTGQIKRVKMIRFVDHIIVAVKTKVKFHTDKKEQ